MSYAGMEGGDALADVLSSRHKPSAQMLDGIVAGGGPEHLPQRLDEMGMMMPWRRSTCSAASCSRRGASTANDAECGASPAPTNSFAGHPGQPWTASYLVGGAHGDVYQQARHRPHRPTRARPHDAQPAAYSAVLKAAAVLTPAPSTTSPTPKPSVSPSTIEPNPSIDAAPIRAAYNKGTA